MVALFLKSRLPTGVVMTSGVSPSIKTMVAGVSGESYRTLSIATTEEQARENHRLAVLRWTAKSPDRKATRHD